MFGKCAAGEEECRYRPLYLCLESSKLELIRVAALLLVATDWGELGHLCRALLRRSLRQYLAIVFVFAVVYRMMSAFLPCELGLASIREAYLFSLETMTTVGYGTNDYLFGTCWLMLPVLSVQAFIGLLIDAFLIGVLFARISRPQTRASTVLFSKHAVIRRVRQEAYFM